MLEGGGGGATGLLNKGGGNNKLPTLVAKQQAVEFPQVLTSGYNNNTLIINLNYMWSSHTVLNPLSYHHCPES